MKARQTYPEIDLATALRRMRRELRREHWTWGSLLVLDLLGVFEVPDHAGRWKLGLYDDGENRMVVTECPDGYQWGGDEHPEEELNKPILRGMRELIERMECAAYEIALRDGIDFKPSSIRREEINESRLEIQS